MVGYCLTGVTSEHALFFLYGTGANGKSVFVNVLTTILGDYAANAPMDTFMEARTDRHPTDLAGCAAHASCHPSKPNRVGAGTNPSQGHHRWRQGVRALHAPGLLRVRAAVQVGDRGQPQALDPQRRRSDEAATAPDPFHGDDPERRDGS
jgi:putative DNA primase/helicase